MEVRRAEDESDLRGAVRCYNRAWRVGYRGMVPEDVIEGALRDADEAVAELEDYASVGPSIVLVAEDDGDVVGYLVGRRDDTAEHVADSDAELVELYVDPAHWREGAATSLHDRFAEWLPPRVGGVVAELLAENERAQAFLEEYGYEFRDTSLMEVDGDLHGSGVYRYDLVDDAWDWAE